jgi:hypothetical protein
MRTYIVHTVQNGFCTVCGETEEWLRGNNEPIEIEWIGLEIPPTI